MERHRAPWRLNTLAVWQQYFLLLVAAVPSAVLGLKLMRHGMAEQQVLIICVGLTVAIAYLAWRFVLSRSTQFEDPSLFYPDFNVERLPPIQSHAEAPKILIISSDSGGGHRSAAAAIVAGVQAFLRGESFAIRVMRAVEETHHITSKLVAGYNWMLRNKQHWMKYLYWGLNRFGPETREFFYKRTVGYVGSQFDRWCPNVVVSVHPLTQHMIARVLKELGLSQRIPLVTIVTDPYYGFWKGWASDDVSLYLVATEDAQQQLINYGISPSRIKVSGRPVHPKFAFPDEAAAQAARRALGLNPEKFTVFVNAGWEGGGNIPVIFRELVRGELDVQAIFLAGKNDELRGEAEQLASQAKFPVKVIGYSDEVEKLMRAANVMISKLGGLSTFEALACGVPIIADATAQPISKDMDTANLIEKRGAGVLLKRAKDIVPVIRRMEADVAHYSAMRAATVTVNTNATRKIVEEIVAFLPKTPKAERSTLLSNVG